ncbi:MAG: SWIM zinc finger family protein [Planctomycetes bacterium]|nr:SWIM zinc finger family protein [Planctomycetota bacterium]
MGRWRSWDRGWEFFPPSRPRAAKGGIKAQSKRGSFGESWWAKRWIAVLESFHIGARLGRGRAYARSGQVTEIEIDEGEVRAKVQGSRPRPYSVSIRIQPFAKADGKRLAEVLGRKAIFAAKLLAGEMPQDIEDAFREARLSLFPEKLRDLRTECSCPDWSNPCKHIAAVYYLLGEEFDRDPFLIFKLRGLEREELVARATPPAETEPSGSAPRAEALPADPDAFWRTDAAAALPIEGGLWGDARIPPVAAALPKRLGSFPFWRGEETFLEAMERACAEASASALAIFFGAEGLRPPSLIPRASARRP